MSSTGNMSYQWTTNTSGKICPFTKNTPLQVCSHHMVSCLKCTLFIREHLGLLDNSDGERIVEDPVIRHFYEVCDY